MSTTIEKSYLLSLSWLTSLIVSSSFCLISSASPSTLSFVLSSFVSSLTLKMLRISKQSLLEVKRLKKVGTGGLEKIEHFYLSQPITLHPQNSIFFYLRTYPEWPGISIFSYPLVYPPTELESIFFSIFRDRPLVYFSIPHLS